MLQPSQSTKGDPVCGSRQSRSSLLHVRLALPCFDRQRISDNVVNSYLIGDEMKATPLLLWLYLLNAAVLITHEIDAAYWREWELFGIPGGIQTFLGINLILVIVVLYGHQALALGRFSGMALSWALVAASLVAVMIHTCFLLQGSDAFKLPASLALLVAALVFSLAQAAALLSIRNATRKATGRGTE